MTRFLVAVVSIVLVCQPAMATTPVAGQVIVKGNVTVNGMTVPSGTTLFQGDRVATEANTVAELILNDGTQVMLPASSAVDVRSETLQKPASTKDSGAMRINLRQGSLAILSKNSLPAIVEANGARIKAAADTAAVIEVAINKNSLKVLTRRGGATVETVGKSLEVKEGYELDATMAPTPPQGASAAGVSKIQTWIIITAAVAGLTGLALGVVAITRSNPADCRVISPSGQTIVCP